MWDTSLGLAAGSVNNTLEIQAQTYKEHILKEVEVSTNQIINDAED